MYCLRCGREIEEGASFCRECLKEVGKPLEETPYLSKRITLPSRAPRPQTAAPVPPANLSKPERKKSRKGLIAAVSLLSVFCLLLAGCCLWFLRDRLFGLDTTANRERVLEEENIHLSNELSRAQTELTRESEQAGVLRSENEELRGQVSGLEENLNGDRMEHSELDFSIRELEEQNRKLEKEKKNLEGQNRNLNNKKQKLEEQVEDFETRFTELENLQKTTAEKNTQLALDLKELRTENSSLAAAVRFVDKHIAFINKGSRYYHTLSCMDFDSYSGWFAYNISAAKENGYLPCPKCH